jgi:hypothetical protein
MPASITNVKATEPELSAAVSKALGQPVTMHLSIEARRNGEQYLTAVSDPLLISGPAYFMFSTLKVGSFGGIYIAAEDNDENMAAVFDLHFEYTHHTGGSNGCTAGAFGKRIRMVCSSEYKYGMRSLVWAADVL